LEDFVSTVIHPIRSPAPTFHLHAPHFGIRRSAPKNAPDPDLILSRDFAMLHFTDPPEFNCETPCSEGHANLSLGT
jgi:hypothetical protein